MYISFIRFALAVTLLMGLSGCDERLRGVTELEMTLHAPLDTGTAGPTARPSGAVMLGDADELFLTLTAPAAPAPGGTWAIWWLVGGNTVLATRLGELTVEPGKPWAVTTVPRPKKGGLGDVIAITLEKSADVPTPAGPVLAFARWPAATQSDLQFPAFEGAYLEALKSAIGSLYADTATGMLHLSGSGVPLAPEGFEYHVWIEAEPPPPDVDPMAGMDHSNMAGMDHSKMDSGKADAGHDHGKAGPWANVSSSVDHPIDGHDHPEGLYHLGPLTVGFGGTFMRMWMGMQLGPVATQLHTLKQVMVSIEPAGTDPTEPARFCVLTGLRGSGGHIVADEALTGGGHVH